MPSTNLLFFPFCQPLFQTENCCIFGETLDELIPVIALIEGIPSRESAKSFNRWRQQRAVSSE